VTERRTTRCRTRSPTSQGDREIKVLIHTGSGENYNANWGPAPTSQPIYVAMDDQKGLSKLDEKTWYGRMLIENVLAVEVPVVSAVNGPCNIYSRCRCSVTSCLENAQRQFFPVGGGMAPLDRPWNEKPWSD